MKQLNQIFKDMKIPKEKCQVCKRILDYNEEAHEVYIYATNTETGFVCDHCVELYRHD